MIFLTTNVKILEEDLDWSPSWREHVALKNTGDDMSRVMGLDPLDGVPQFDLGDELGFGQMLDYGVIGPRLQQLYEWSARELGAPGLLDCIRDGDLTTPGPWTTGASGTLESPSPSS